MAWARFGDTSHSHRKVLRAQARDPVRGATVWGVVTLCLSWSTQESQDWWVSESFVRRTFGDQGPRLMREAQACGLVRPGRQRRGGENGWLIDDSDPDLLHIRTREEVDRDRDKSRATRQVEPVREVRLRDGDQCRFCGKTVSWTDRTSARRGTYDHPDPAVREVFVVACGECNNAKYNRTVEQWVAAGGLALLDPPTNPLIGQKTAEQFGVTQSFSAHTGSQPADAATLRPGSQPAVAPKPDAAVGAQALTDLPELDLAGPRVAELPASGRDGPRSGQVGTGRAGTRSGAPNPTPASTDGSRGSRGMRTGRDQP